jgi:hypothetical protein
MFFNRFLNRSMRPARNRKIDHRAWLRVEQMEDRVTPANCVWSGGGGALWSDAVNWSTNTVPGPNDTATFNNTDNNSCKMDLTTRVGQLTISGYTGTITLTKLLSVDVLTMSSGTITVDPLAFESGTNGHMWVRQDVANIFGASSWTGGNIGGGYDGFEFKIIGSGTHPLTFNLGSATSTPTFAGKEWDIYQTAARTDTTVNWDNGSVNLATPTTLQRIVIRNEGTFFARSGGKISSNDPTKKWRLDNFGDLITKTKTGQFEYNIPINKTGGNTYIRAALDGTPGTFTIVGGVIQEDGGVEVESGTLKVLAVAAGDGGDYTMLDGTLTGDFYTSLTLDTTYEQSGGTATMSLAAVTAGTDFIVSAGTFKYIGTGTSNILTANTVSIERTSSTVFGTFVVLGNVNVNTTTFTTAGLLDLQSTSQNPTTGALILYGHDGGDTAEFTQTSDGVDNLRLTSSMTSIIDIHGTGDFAGTAYVLKDSSVTLTMYHEYWLINGDTLTGSVTWDFTGASLPYGHWITGTDNSDGRDHWYIEWVM